MARKTERISFLMSRSAPDSASAPVPAKLLVVDSDPASRWMLEEMLRREGHTVLEASSGDDTLALQREFSPVLILLVAAPAERDGLALCRRLREAQQGEGAPILLVLPANAVTDAATAFAAGAADILRRPLQPAEVTARVAMHLKVRDFATERRRLTEELADAKDASHRFLGRMAHELRNPLSSLRGLADFLRDNAIGRLNADQLELVNAIHATSDTMLNLVNDLLDVAAIEAGALKIEREVRDLAEVIESAVHLARIQASRKKIGVQLAAPPSLPAVAIDAPRLRQVADNLLSNAVKYSPPGSTIMVELTVGEGRCGFRVKDQGPGIPAAERDRLFKDFGRLSVRPTGGEKSTGLGLAISRKIIEAHGGTIGAENLPEGGCEFRVDLPVAEETGGRSEPFCAAESPKLTAAARAAG